MRIIKFRAWSKEEKAMTTCWDLHHIPVAILTEKLDCELMQFTGLLDKNGKEIYEGDILEIVEAHEEGCGCDHCFPYQNGDKVKVVWFDASFGLLPAKYEIKEDYCEKCAGYIGLMSPNHEMDIGFFGKIVGNIHESPELLKEGKA